MSSSLETAMPTYRVIHGKHSQREDGENKVYEKGQTFVVVDSKTVERMVGDSKFEKVSEEPIATKDN